MSAGATQTGLRPDEPAIVFAWRFDMLRRAGFPIDHALPLATSQADLHQATLMLEQGCTPELVWRILA